VAKLSPEKVQISTHAEDVEMVSGPPENVENMTRRRRAKHTLNESDDEEEAPQPKSTTKKRTYQEST